ncbi:MAG: hypothetical protein ACPGTT_07940, partial [Candidatus Poseidoniaceae archaeon]
MKGKLKNIHTSNHHAMRKIAVALMILFSLMVIPNSIGQNPTPTAAIEMDCDSDPIEVYHLYEINEGISYEVDFDPWINKEFECTIYNPTSYQEVVEISYSIANSPEAMALEIDEENI